MRAVVDTNVFISELMLATLIASKADCLVAGDLDLLALADTYPILSPVDFADRIF